MAFRVFSIPIRDPKSAEQEVNAFLQSHKVLAVDRRWVDQGADSFWSFCVDYHTSAQSSAPATPSKKSQIDYREVFGEEDFALFSELRELRKQLAQAEGVAVYVVFTNDHLAKMVQQQATTMADLEKIAGAGSARITKYGEPFVEALTIYRSSQDAASRKPK